MYEYKILNIKLCIYEIFNEFQVSKKFSMNIKYQGNFLFISNLVEKVDKNKKSTTIFNIQIYSSLAMKIKFW